MGRIPSDQEIDQPISSSFNLESVVFIFLSILNLLDTLFFFGPLHPFLFTLQVHKYIEDCIQQYMSKKETMECLAFYFKIGPTFTRIVWEKLEQDNPEFFRSYKMRLLVKDQIMNFNRLLLKQVELMHRYRNNGNANGLISNGSHVLRNGHTSNGNANGLTSNGFHASRNDHTSNGNVNGLIFNGSHVSRNGHTSNGNANGLISNGSHVSRNGHTSNGNANGIISNRSHVSRNGHTSNGNANGLISNRSHVSRNGHTSIGNASGLISNRSHVSTPQISTPNAARSSREDMMQQQQRFNDNMSSIQSCMQWRSDLFLHSRETGVSPNMQLAQRMNEQIVRTGRGCIGISHYNFQ